MMREVLTTSRTGQARASHRGPPPRSAWTPGDWSEAFALVPSLQVGYVWYASIHTLEVLEGLLGIGFELAGQIIWDKGLFSVGRSWYHWATSRVVVRRPGVPHLFIGERDQATIWRPPAQADRGRLEETRRTTRPRSRCSSRDPDPQPPPGG
jgi:hypothetical protein